MDFENYIGQNFKEVSNEIDSYIIENNDFELELNEGLEERYFVKSESGSFKMILDKNRNIQTIFLFPLEDSFFLMKGYNVDMGRTGVRNKLGNPDKVGEPFVSPILGSTGGFDRYDRNVVYHFEYEDAEQKRIKKITLMSKETAP